MPESSAATRPAVAEKSGPSALKEWALIGDLLLSGRMCVLFRKGGINEKGFWVEADEFLVFPTYFHQNRDKVRPGYRDAFDVAMGRTPPDGVLRIPARCRVVVCRAAVPIATQSCARLSG